MRKGGPVPRARFLPLQDMIRQRLGQVWLYHGGPPVETLQRPHGFRERVSPLENLEHDEVNRTEPEEGAESDPIQL